MMGNTEQGGESAYVSIIIITGNQKAELQNTIAHILAQTFKDFEIIIVDIMSQDESEDMVVELYGDLDNIVYLYSDTMISRAEAINTGINVSSGKYMAFAESGVIWNKSFLNDMLELIRKEKNLCWAYCNSCQKSGAEEIYLPPREWPSYKKQGKILPDLLMLSYINLNTVVFSFDMIKEVGALDANLPAMYDYEFLLRLAAKYPAAYREDCVVEVPEIIRKYKDHILAQCYILAEFAGWLDKFGIKKERFEYVKWLSMKYRQEKLFDECAELLSCDEDYSQWLNQNYVAETTMAKQRLNQGEHVGHVKECVGCGACEAVCPVQAIQLRYNEKGFWAPRIQERECIHCGRCQQVCVKLNKPQGKVNPSVCYAVQGNDISRLNSSSGGIFPLLANAVLQSGGYVAGAVFDERFHVRHIVSNSRDDIVRMYSSKYAQSDMRGVFQTIRELLDCEKKVLFTGCACQAASLKAYLGKEYGNLLTMDVVCHGVPSPGILDGHIDALEKRRGKIVELSFRKKEKLGWNTGIYAEFEDGTEYIAYADDLFLKSFLNNWSLNDSCFSCEYKDVKYSDITAGDFWGISQLDKGPWDDGGTSYITLNSGKGIKLFQEIEKDVRYCDRLLSKDAEKYNPAIKKAPDKKALSDLLWEVDPLTDLGAAINSTYEKLHFDVGLVLYWSRNYGNAMTNYALYQIVARKRNVVSIDNMLSSPEERFKDFATRYQKCSSEYYAAGDLYTLGNSCETFVVGSDQAWNKETGCGSYFQLGFVKSPAKKVSYAASFGQRGQEPPAEEYTQYYEAFDHISVREPSGVIGCREVYGVDAEQVLDPVLLLKSDDYHILTQKIIPLEKQSFVLAYFLNPTPQKRKLSKIVSEILGNIKIIYITEEHPLLIDRNRHVLEFDNVKTGLEPEQWLYYFEHCEYVLTDSFHGTCFAMIFQKQFLTFINRQGERFEVFRRFTGLESRILDPAAEVDYVSLLYQEIDYNCVNQELEKERIRSLQWLENAL